MSEEKRAQLIASGQLREDGSRIERCPTCGTELSEEQAAAIRGVEGSAEGVPETVAASTSGADAGQEG